LINETGDDRLGPLGEPRSGGCSATRCRSDKCARRRRKTIVELSAASIHPPYAHDGTGICNSWRQQPESTNRPYRGTLLIAEGSHAAGMKPEKP
jgi:hypothetical protein